jgi:hypothetical protein
VYRRSGGAKGPHFQTVGGDRKSVAWQATFASMLRGASFAASQMLVIRGKMTPVTRAEFIGDRTSRRDAEFQQSIAAAEAAR